MGQIKNIKLHIVTDIKLYEDKMSAKFQISLKGDTINEVAVEPPVYNAKDLSSVIDGLKHLRKMNQEIMSKIVEEDKAKISPKRKLDDISLEEGEDEISSDG